MFNCESGCTLYVSTRLTADGVCVCVCVFYTGIEGSNGEARRKEQEQTHGTQSRRGLKTGRNTSNANPDTGKSQNTATRNPNLHRNTHTSAPHTHHKHNPADTQAHKGPAETRPAGQPPAHAGGPRRRPGPTGRWPSANAERRTLAPPRDHPNPPEPWHTEAPGTNPPEPQIRQTRRNPKRRSGQGNPQAPPVNPAPKPYHPNPQSPSADRPGDPSSARVALEGDEVISGHSSPGRTGLPARRPKNGALART